jgi:hypothetical protein
MLHPGAEIKHQLKRKAAGRWYLRCAVAEFSSNKNAGLFDARASGAFDQFLRAVPSEGVTALRAVAPRRLSLCRALLTGVSANGKRAP